VSSWELHRGIGVTQKTAWFMLQRIRLAMQDSDTGGKLGGEVEVDETFIGGKARNMSPARKQRKGISQNTSMASKAAVMGLLERHPQKGKSKIRLQPLDNRKRDALLGQVRANIEMGSTVHTDALKSYLGLADEGYLHNVIDHAEAYVDGNVHTNGCENFWSLLKRALKGTYVAVEPFHLFRYLDEQAFRFNNRTWKDGERFDAVVDGVIGRRLMYKDLIAALSAGTPA
jgi:transposase-like protein